MLLIFARKLLKKDMKRIKTTPEYSTQVICTDGSSLKMDYLFAKNDVSKNQSTYIYVPSYRLPMGYENGGPKSVWPQWCT